MADVEIRLNRTRAVIQGDVLRRAFGRLRVLDNVRSPRLPRAKVFLERFFHFLVFDVTYDKYHGVIGNVIFVVERSDVVTSHGVNRLDRRLNGVGMVSVHHGVEMPIGHSIGVSELKFQFRSHPLAFFFELVFRKSGIDYDVGKELVSRVEVFAQNRDVQKGKIVSRTRVIITSHRFDPLREFGRVLVLRPFV